MMALSALHSLYGLLGQGYSRLSRISLPSWQEIASHVGDALRDGSRFF